MSRKSREYWALRREVEKLFGEEKEQDYHTAMVDYIQTGELPKNKKLRQQFEHDNRQLEMMMATLPFATETECREVRTKVFGNSVCQKCEWHSRCFNDDGQFLDDEEIEDCNMGEQ